MTHFPIPTDVSGLWLRSGVRNMKRWEELERERTAAREIAIAWRDAAIADGWQLQPTYRHESAESHGTIAIESRIGTFKGHVDTRPNRRSEEARDWSLGAGEVTIWAPDSLQVLVPLIYPGIEALIAATRHCKNCGANDVETERYSFAGRCCAKCRPEMARIHERSGWCD